MLFSKEKKRPADKKQAADKKRPAARAGAARPAGDRPAAARSAAARPGAAQQPRRRPPQQTAPRPQPDTQPQAENQTGESFEVYVPDAESQSARFAPEPGQGAPRQAASRPRSNAAAAPRQRRPQSTRDAQYQPYRQANQRTKAKKKLDFQQNIQKFFSSQNPILNAFHKEDPNVFGDDARAARREKRAAEAEKKRRRAERLNTPAMIYTQPVSFNSRRLAIQLITILAVVLALVLGMSVFFKVKQIGVAGAKSYPEWTIAQTSGIKEGDNLLTINRTRASGKIVANLPYVKSARIGIKLPDTVIIEIEEAAVFYSIQDQDGVWWLINSDGKVVEQTNAQTARNYTKVLGVTIYQPQAGEIGVATEEAPVETDPTTGEAVQALITGAQRLRYALQILQQLELNDIVGEAASVDVSQTQDITLWYGTQYQVNLGSIADMEKKIVYMKNAIMQMNDYQTGILDISFTTWPDQVGYTPFD